MTGARGRSIEAWDVEASIVEVHVDFDRRHEDEAAGSEPALVVVEAVPRRSLAGWAGGRSTVRIRASGQGSR